MSHETIVQPSRNGQPATDVVKMPDPEVVPKAERRRFSASTSCASSLKPTPVPSTARLAPCYTGKGFTARTWTNGASKRRAGALQALCPAEATRPQR